MTLRTALAALVVPVALALSAVPARAQAYVPEQGEGSVSVLYQNTLVTTHYLTTTAYDMGQIRSNTLLVDVTYGLTDKVAVSIGIPWVASKWTGTGVVDPAHNIVSVPHPLPLAGPVTLDDGAYHDTFQDFRFNVRYNAVKQRGFALTPFVGSILPSHGYTTFAHAAPGRDLNELQVGVSAAKMLDALVPGLFVQGSYSYGFTEQVLDIAHNRSIVDLEAGYFVTPKLRALFLGSGQITHGGIDGTLETAFDPVLFPVHDQVTKDNFLNLGGGAAYSLNDKIDIFGSMIHTVAVRNVHAIDYGVSFGLSVSFSTHHSKDRAIASNEDSLSRCLCEKGMK
jgi:hypothetical protein